MLKKTIAFLIITNMTVSAHTQDVHKYLSKEGYYYLKNSLGLDIPVMLNHLGTLIEIDSESSWQHGTIIAGASLEDDHDPVYNYDNYVSISQPLEFLEDHSFTSITHFWDADNGDDPENTFTFGGSDFHRTEGTFPNAYTKIKKLGYSLLSS